MGNNRSKQNQRKKQPHQPPKPVAAGNSEKDNDVPDNLPPSNQLYAIAKFDYESREVDELSIKKGDRLELLEQNDDDWWRAKLRNCIGLVPSNYVRLDDDSPENTDGYMNVTRQEATRLLLLPHVKHGQFIVRPSSVANYLVLSVRMQVDEQVNPEVKNFQVRVLPDKSLSVCANNPNVVCKLDFANLEQLLQYYTAEFGLGCKLAGPFPRTRPPNVALKAVEVSRNLVQEIKLIGKGSFGEVFLGKLYGTVDVVIKKAEPDGTKPTQRILDEAEIMRKVQHDKIVLLYGVCTTETPMLIITEYMPNGNLCSYLQKLRSKPFDQCPEGWNSPHRRFSSQVSMITQIATAMEHLESLNILHRDLRAANVLVGDNDEVKVADFGLAKLLGDNTIYFGSADSKFPIRWAAPEVLTDNCLSVSSDVWSFGVLTFEVITMGDLPYGSLTSYEEVTAAIKSSETTRLLHDGVKTSCPPSFYDEVMVPCWQQVIGDRPSFKDLRSKLDRYEPRDDEQHYFEVNETLQPERPLGSTDEENRAEQLSEGN